MAIQVYSFLDVSATIQGPNGSFPLGVGAAVAEEGITTDYSIDSETMNIGADGTPMHSLHASKGGMISVKLQKTSPTNSNLMTMWKADRANGSQDWGQNTLTITNVARGDSIVAQSVAFRKPPANVNAQDGGIMDWIFNCGTIDETIGDGNPTNNAITQGAG